MRREYDNHPPRFAGRSPNGWLVPPLELPREALSKREALLMKISNNLIARKVPLFIVSIFLLSSLTSAPTALAAEKGYRYWGYFHAAPGATAWTPAMTGPTVDVADGAVEGWAFTFSDDDIPDASAPRRAPDFKELCGTTKSVSGKKRVGIYIDFGPSALRPKGEKLPRNIGKCIVTDVKSQGIDVLGAAVKIRAASSGFICGINNYPEKECGVEIKTPLKYRLKK